MRGRAPERVAVARLRRDAGDRPLRRPVHAGRLLLQDVHPPAPPVAGLREGAAQRRRPRAPARAAGRARVAHRVPPPPLRRAGHRRRRRRPRRGASRAAELGADVVLCDEDVEPGGALLARGRPRARPRARRGGPATPASRSSPARPRSATSTASSRSGRATRCTRSAPPRTSPRPASIEQPLVFPDNDLPGRDARRRRAAARRALRRARRAAPRSSRPTTTAASTPRSRCSEAGVDDRRRRRPARRRGRRRSARRARSGRASELLPGATVVRADGRQARQPARAGAVDARGRAIAGSERASTATCSRSAAAPRPRSSLLLQARRRRRATTRPRAASCPARCPRACTPPARSSAHDGRDARELSGAIAGAEAALALGFGDADERRRLRRGARAPRARPAPIAGRGAGLRAPTARTRRQGVRRPRRGRHRQGHQARASAEGYDSIELSKRYTTVTMGPSQGRFSQLPSVRVLGRRDRASTLDDVGLTTARPPWTHGPDGRARRPAVRGRQALGRSTAATASWAPRCSWAGDWRRAYDYGDPEAEALAVQTSAGPDRRLHARQADRPRAGRRRAARPPLPEPDVEPRAGPDPLRRPHAPTPGRITDDGTVCRLDEDTLLRHHHLERRRRGGAVVLLVAGRLGARRAPHRRHPGRRGDEPRRAATRARSSAGSPTSTSRNEAFSVHGRASALTSRACPACCCASASSARSATRSTAPPRTASTLWDALLEAGAELGIRPFGLEPQRMLRLQKLHILVGQDTDSESTPVRRRAGLDRQARQGAGLHRQVGARARAQTGRRRPRWSASAADGRRCRPRARSSSQRRRAGRPGDQRAPLAEARPGRSAWPGCRPGSPRDGARITISDAGRTARRRSSRPSRSTTPKGRCCAREHSAFLHARRAARRRPRAQPARRARAAAAGARFEVARRLERRGRATATPSRERRPCRETVGFADVSHLGKLELQAPKATPTRSPRRRRRELGRSAPRWRRLVVPLTRPTARSCDPRAGGDRRARAATAARHVLDVDRPQYGALAIAGPLARETFARFCALDLRPAVDCRSAGFRPGSVARTPGYRRCARARTGSCCCSARPRRVHVGVVADAGAHLGGRPVGLDALPRRDRAEEARPDA